MTKTPVSFNAFYQSHWGKRWAPLQSAMVQPQRYVAHVNRFVPADQQRSLFENAPVRNAAFLAYPLANQKTPQQNEQGLLQFYPMDYASLLAAAALETHEGERVLDLCAAPGGKALCLIEQVAAPEDITLNESSRTRRKRLLNVLTEYVPENIRQRIKVTNYDGRLYWKRTKTIYDKILVDAPCSGERHLLQHPNELKKWSPARSRNLSYRQYALLASALRMLKPGGRLVYVTCSISPLENDGVVAKLLKKKSDQVEPIPLSLAIGEATEHGWQILPDTADGWGPLYCAAVSLAR